MASISSLQRDPLQAISRPYKCPLCGTAFRRLEHQIRHIRTHTRERPYACAYFGCSRTFPRSDELIRHSRTHDNPRPRKCKAPHVKAPQAPVATFQPRVIKPNPRLEHTIPLPPKSISHSPLISRVSPLDASPSNPFSKYSLDAGSELVRYQHGGLNNNEVNHQSRNIDFITDTDCRLDYPHASRHWCPDPGNRSCYTRLPRLSQYLQLSQPFPRSHSNEDEIIYTESMQIKSRPGSLRSPTPPSPADTSDCAISTPDYTPLATPLPSPQIRPHSLENLTLPCWRKLKLNLYFVPALAPLEPPTEWEPSYVPNRSSGCRIGDIISNPERSQRKLPVPWIPKVVGQDLLNDVDGCGC